MFGLALDTHPGLGWLAALGTSARGATRTDDRARGNHAGPDPDGRGRHRAPLGIGRTDIATILFADICGSTPLYQAAGDHEALALVAQCIDTLVSIAREHGGEVVRSKGDDLLCTFPDTEAALVAARRMASAQRKSDARVRVALHHGKLIRARGDIFGDAVNLAARVLGLGKPDEVLTTREVFTRLPATERGGLRRLGEHALKGVGEAVCIYSALPLDTTDPTTLRNIGTTTLTLNPAPRPKVGRATLVVDCGASRVRFEEGETLRIGRAPGCDVVVPLSWVSREHASVTLRDGKLTLEDHSSTGTHVELADGHAFAVRRETVVLGGTGTLMPGGQHAQSEPFVVRFTVEQPA